MKLFAPIFYRRILYVALLLFASNAVRANHLVGMDLNYTHVTGNTYKITLSVYADCGAATAGSAFGALPTSVPEVYIFNGGTLLDSINLRIEPPSGGVEITPVCPAYLSLTQCTSLSFPTPGIKKFVYSANYTLPGISPVWRFLFTGSLGASAVGITIAGRALPITNISSAPVTYIQLVDTLNNTVGANSNPDLTNIPTPFFCLPVTNNYNPGAVDPDSDSLRFYLVDGANGTTEHTLGGSVTYIAPYTGSAPLAVTSMSFNQSTGQISFTPSALQRSLVVYNIREFKSGVFVGSCQREMTFLVQACSNTPPNGDFSSASAGTIVDEKNFQICRNSGPFTLHIFPYQAVTTNNITVTTSGLPPGLTFTTMANGTPTPHCVLSWTSTGVAPGTYTFYVTYTDNNCPLSGKQTIAYTITIMPQATVSASVVSTMTCSQKAAVTTVPGGDGGPWKVILRNATAPFDTISVRWPVSTALTDSLTAGTYNLIVSPTGVGCEASATVTVIPPVFATPVLSFTHPSYCGFSDGSIRLSGLLPGTIDTIKYTRNSVAQTPLVRMVGSDGSVTLTGLSAGVYSNFVVTYGRYCSSLPAGPVTLVNPPFTMRAITGTDPPYCGFCTGVIRLYGLHPGQIDTITYIKDGVMQPPVVRLIGPDSMVIIGGLCPGLYFNFVAKTAGVCVSNVLGPVRISVPPFVVDRVSFSNPDYCGVCNGTITLHGLYPFQTDTVTYMRDGVVQPPVVATIGADSTLVISGLCEGNYTNIIARTAGICVSADAGPVTLVAPPFTVRSISFTNPPYCGICTGTITLHGLYPGQIDTITYTRDGVVQPAVVRLIGSDSTVTITDLCAGVYDNFVARTAGVCVSDTLGPVSLTVPPFTARAIDFTNPDYCGTCNGIIRLYGLHPGQLDTVSFTRYGVPQPPFVQFVGADSIITITGLCQGDYDNFIVRTAGVCATDPFGPLSLTVPPFTIRALSHTNPPYCGVCTGTITIYGAFPGLLDTVTYTRDGIAQPPFIAAVGADSTITITGLCAGVYDNFVAHTGGVCVSNTLGPETLTVPPFTMRALSFTNPPYCGECTGTIALYGLYPGQTDTVSFTKDGIAQPPHIQLVGADSTITITGLCAGVYDNFIARTGGVCVSNTLGPATLTVPPFTMRSLSFTNPPYCGICTGTVTLYGLYPGQTDTISYTKDGVAQTPHIQVVGADSTVTITGLCAGLYDNFIARTGGVCVSNTLGPANLTVPPFSMRALSFTNPPYCGECTGTITLYGLYPGQTDTISFTKDGAPFPPVVQTAAADSTIVITGLCAGLYENFVARTGGVCVSNTLGPANLTIPAFTMRAINRTNPTKCGWCDGVIRLYGLYPGQTDTVTYKRNGVVQPPVSFTVGADSMITITGLCDGVYSDFVARTGGVCVSNTLGPVTLVDPPMIAAFDFTLKQNCDADTAYFINRSVPAADLTYRWTFGDGDSSTFINPVHFYTVSANYKVKLEVTNTRCVDSMITFIPVTNILKAGFTAVPDSFLCAGDPVVFTNTSSGTGLKYVWSLGDGSTLSAKDLTHIYKYSGEYSIVLAVSNDAPCYDTAVAVIAVDSISDISIKVTDSVLCGGRSVAFSGIYSESGNTGVRWSFSDSSTVFNENPIVRGFVYSGMLTVRLDAYYRACPDTFATRTVWAFDHPQVYLGGDTSICPGGAAITLRDRTIGDVPGVRWVWSTGEKTRTIQATSPGSYWVTITLDGCTATDTIQLVGDCFMDVPNVFSPNGDGVNDYFMPRPDAAKGLGTFSMSIFNRWGQTVFETDNIYGRGWDGRFNGSEQPQGVYIYLIDATFVDGQKETHKGNVTLLR